MPASHQSSGSTDGASLATLTCTSTVRLLCTHVPRMLSNRVAAKRAYHRRVEKMESLQKENSFLTQILSERQQRKQHLEALVS